MCSLGEMAVRSSWGALTKKSTWNWGGELREKKVSSVEWKSGKFPQVMAVGLSSRMVSDR